MSIRAIITGSLSKAPIEKTSSKGNRYLIANIREGSLRSIRESEADPFRPKTEGETHPIARAVMGIPARRRPNRVLSSQTRIISPGRGRWRASRQRSTWQL
jgi:hypothetical protein